jgi:hypothetical protein
MTMTSIPRHQDRHPAATPPGGKTVSIAAERLGAPSRKSKPPQNVSRRDRRRKRHPVRAARTLEIVRRKASACGAAGAPPAIAPPASSARNAPARAPAATPAVVLRLPIWLCVLAVEAMAALDGRAEADSRGYRLDGRPATLRELVLAAHSVGADLPYPRVRPHVRAHHPGPSMALPRIRRRRKRRTSAKRRVERAAAKTGAPT